MEQHVRNVLQPSTVSGPLNGISMEQGALSNHVNKIRSCRSSTGYSGFQRGNDAALPPKILIWRRILLPEERI